ncbi:MAG: DUF6119 family protein [Nocardioides sp.]
MVIKHIWPSLGSSGRPNLRVHFLDSATARCLIWPRLSHSSGRRGICGSNQIDPSQLRSLDTKTFEDMVVTTNRQTSRNAELPAFGVDVSTDILRAATGAPRDATFAKRLSGSDGLVMNLGVDATDRPALCVRLLEAFRAQDYKADFGWIDQLALIRDDATVDRLNGLLVEELASGAVSSTHLASPEPVSWEDIDAFRIGGTRNWEYDDLDLDAYLRQLGPARRNITVERLKSRRVADSFREG